MKYLYIYILLLFNFTISFAQINEQDTIVNVKIFWNKDDVKVYNFKNKEVKKTQEKIDQSEEISYKVTIKVEDIFEDERTVSWTYDQIKFNSDKFINNPLSLIKQIQIKFVIDKDGRILRYQDLDETVNSFISASEKFQNNYLDDKEFIAQINDLVKQYATSENIIKIFEKDINQFHLFYGRGEFKPLTTKVEFTSYMDNLFSTSPTPATTVIQLDEISYSGTNYIMSSFQQADKEWLANSWFNYLKKLADKLGTGQPEDSRLHDEIIYNVKTNSRIKDNGWLSYSKETKKVQFQDTDYTIERVIELE